jgi:hypothetical protein
MDVTRASSRHEAGHPSDPSAEPTTSDVVKGARKQAGIGGAAPDVRGDDKTRAEVKMHQQEHIGFMGAAHVAHAAVEGAHLAELHVMHAAEAKLAAAVGAGGGAAVVLGGGAALGLFLGYHHIRESHENGKEQREALEKGPMRVAILAVMDLPTDYKASRIESFKEVPRTARSAATKITEALMGEPAAVSVIRKHADAGVDAGLDARASGLSTQAYLAQRPAIAKRCAEDVAFREGFDAATTLQGGALAALRAGRDSRSPVMSAREVRVSG